ncbi:MAG: iron-sulfur cluster repair di-iron protein [Candidatus Binatia bacterium]
MGASQQSLAAIALGTPAAARVFHRYRLDFCCGGQRSLEEACAAKGLDAEQVSAEIAASSADSSGDEVAGMTDTELTAYIVRRYHAPLREELPRLVGLARKVEAVHADKPDCPRGLAEHLSRMSRSIEEHLDKEERILFPMIAAGRGSVAAMPVRVMMQEHLDHADNLAHLRRLAREFCAPADACTSWRVLYDALGELELELMRHMHLENNALFPRILMA